MAGGLDAPARALRRRLLAHGRRTRRRLRASSTTPTPTQCARPARCRAARRSWRRWPWPSRWPTRSPSLAAGGAARLESIFLDEGFGTLDPDTLDVVAAAIEELGARGRMVGVVTHVRELAERLPVRFEVRKVGGVGRRRAGRGVTVAASTIEPA